MSEVLGGLIQVEYVAKIADDLYIDGHTWYEALTNWESRVRGTPA